LIELASRSSQADTLISAGPADSQEITLSWLPATPASSMMPLIRAGQAFSR